MTFSRTCPARPRILPATAEPITETSASAIGYTRIRNARTHLRRAANPPATCECGAPARLATGDYHRWIHATGRQYV